VEHSEHHMPLLYLYMRETPDSGGAGRYARGNSLEIAVKLHGAEELTVASVSGDVAVPGTPGLYGGRSGVTNRAAWLRDTDIERAFEQGQMPHTLEQIGGHAEGLPPISAGETWRAGTGTVVQYRVSGSAGYGDPLDRELELLEEDLDLNYVSRQAAEKTYGVVFDEDEIDAGATKRNRAAVREQRLAEFDAPVHAFDAVPELATPQGGGLLLAETVEARTGTDGELYAACVACGVALAPAREPIKEWLPQETLPAQDISPAQQDPEELVDGPFEFRLWCCHGCGRLVDTEISRADDPPLNAARVVTFTNLETS
jgi:N-methylhydantoinase B